MAQKPADFFPGIMAPPLEVTHSRKKHRIEGGEIIRLIGVINFTTGQQTTPET